eukprot:5410056-Pyramimonas_sp.AAC.1
MTSEIFYEEAMSPYTNIQQLQDRIGSAEFEVKITKLTKERGVRGMLGLPWRFPYSSPSSSFVLASPQSSSACPPSVWSSLHVAYPSPSSSQRERGSMTSRSWEMNGVGR